MPEDRTYLVVRAGSLTGPGENLSPLLHPLFLPVFVNLSPAAGRQRRAEAPDQASKDVLVRSRQAPQSTSFQLERKKVFVKFILWSA